MTKSFLFVKGPFESKYHLLISGREKVRTEKSKNTKAFIDYSQTIDDVYENLEDYNPTKKMKVLIVFDDMIANVEADKKLSPKVNELFPEERKLNISLVFISQWYFKMSKTKCNTLFYHGNPNIISIY